MERQRIWVTGSQGLIGNTICLVGARDFAEFDFVPMPRDRLELTSPGSIRSAFRAVPPAGVIHCAAISQSPVCQSSPALAEQVNTEATKCLHELAEEVPFIFFSTDLVFDGRKGDYKEEDSPNPLGVYADTKARAEAYVLRNPHHTVVRTSLNAGISPSGNRSFVEEIRRALLQGKTLRLFTDEFRCPIPVEATALAVLSLLRQGSGGIFHVAGADRLSRYEIGVHTARMLGVDASRIVPGTRKDYQGEPRPEDTSLNCSKLEQFLGTPTPSFTAWVAETKDFVSACSRPFPQ